MFRFIQITDTHIGPDRNFNLHGVNTFYYLKGVLEKIRNLDFEYDFIVHTGDIVADPFEASYKLFSEEIEKVKKPIYYVTGNHDSSEMINSYLKTSSKTSLETGKNDYFFNHKGFEFIVLDGRGEDIIDPHGSISEKQFEALEKHLHSINSKTIIFIHYPLFKMDSPWIDERMLLLEGEKLHLLFTKYQQKILGVFLGHIHHANHVIKDNINYISSGSICLQFGQLPNQKKVSFEDHKRGYFNIITLENGQMTIREESVKMQFLVNQ